MSERLIQVAIVDDEDSFRSSLANVFERSGEFRVVYQSPSAMGICEALVENRPDILLLDVTLPQIGGLDALKTIRSTPATATQTVAMLTVHGDLDNVAEAIGPGRADAYITKDESPGRIIYYVRSLFENGGPILSVGRGVERDNGEQPDFRGIKGLSSGQLQIAEMLNQGLKPKEIATRTGTAIATVYRHIHNIKVAIGFRDYDGVLLFEAYLRHYLRSCR